MNFEVIFDNGGGTMLQTEDGFVHHYDYPDQAAEDVKVLLDGGNTSDWEGNEVEYGVMEYDCDTERNGGYRWHTARMVREIVSRGVLNYGDDGAGWHNAEEFYRTLGVEVPEW